MTCDEFRDRVDEFRTGRLDAAAMRELAAHRDACAACAEFVRRRNRPPRLVAAGFLGAFAATVFTLIYTGLHVRDAVTGPDGGARGETQIAPGARQSAADHAVRGAAAAVDSADAEAATEDDAEAATEDDADEASAGNGP